MLGVESKPNDTDRFKADGHEKALEKLGFRGVFGGGALGGALGSLGASLGAALSMTGGGDRGVGSGVGGLRDTTVTSAGLGLSLGVIPGVGGGGGGGGGGGLPGGGGGGGGSERERSSREKEAGGLELVKPSLVLDIASLILYGCQALPIRLKILLDRLFSVLTHDDVLQVLHGFGWSYEDYARGYKLQDRQGNVLHSWHMMSTEEETLVLRQFLRFGETRAIAQQLLHHDASSPRSELSHPHRDPVRESHRERDSYRDIHRDPHRETHRDHHRDVHRDLHRDPLRDIHRDSHRDVRDIRDRESHKDTRDYRDELRREELRREELRRSQQPPHLSHLQHHQQQQQQQPPPDHTKNMDADIKKFLERTNMLFNPFMRDPTNLLRPPPPAAPPLHHGPPPLSAASLASNLFAANPSLATSLLTNPQLASSALSMLRLPVPPVSLPNISPNGSLSNSFGSPTSPMGGSPLNRLQSMQPFDFRKERQSPSPAPRVETSMGFSLPPSGVTSPANSSAGGGCGSTSTGSGGGGGSGVGSGGSSSIICESSKGNVDGSNSISVSGALSAITTSGSMNSFSAHTAQPPPPTPVSINSDPATDYQSDDDDIAIHCSATALNLSTTSTTVSTSVTPTSLPVPPRSQSPGCGRPITPGKRSWNPINLGTSLINPVTGKKRVQCNVCLKTFCDKGALKIHFSAVHLREMHKCTVEGCNMMFSSRRSRNRHSANPNPKLHTPHVRRKISPHDGRTSGAHPVLGHTGFPSQSFQPAGFPPLGPFPGQFGGINPLTGLPFIPPSAAATEDLHKQALELQRRTLEMQHAMGKTSLDLSMRGKEVGELWKHDYGNLNLTGGSDDIAMDGIQGDTFEGKHIVLDDDMDDDSMSVDTQSMRGEGQASSPANKRKRKNQNPTKFAFRLEDDDLISTDDDEDDDDENDDELDDIDPKDSEEDKNEDKELDAMSDVDDDETENNMKESQSLDSNEKPKSDKDSDSSNRKVSSSSYDEAAVDTSNALRHLEDLSKGHFTHMSNTLPPNGTASLGLPTAPSSNGVTSSSPKPSDQDSDRDSNPGSPSEDSECAFHFGEGGFLTNMEIPIDKENPRRCIACGKIFQNHFGVKTHYQNVHLKLMHKCTVEGCNAAFPSKRSRDRHSSNLNLHRKLLSTSSDVPGFPGLGFPGLPFNPALNPELLARLYSDPGTIPLGLDALSAHIPTSLAESLLNGERNSTAGINPGGTNGCSLPPAHPPPHFFLPNLLPHFPNNNNLPGSERKDRSSTPSPQSTTPTTADVTTSAPSMEVSSSPHPPEPTAATTTTMEEDIDDNWVYNLEDDLPSPDRDGNMPCRFCHKTFEDGNGLKSHYEEAHSSELFRCTVDGCNKVFSARRKRNAHSLNDALHRDLLEEMATKDT